MVQVTRELPRDTSGRIDSAAWCEGMCMQHAWLSTGPLMDVCRYLEGLPDGQKYLERGFPLAELTANLKIDNEALLAALLYRPHFEGLLSTAEVELRYSEEVANLVEGVTRMAATNLLDLSNTPMLASERQDQLENVRRLLIALVDDARVAVIKIAERVVALRHAKLDAQARRSRVALEARHVFAPLAGRLGIWHLKWELEDLAMRYLEPEVYATIARQLDGKRAEREVQITRLAEELRRLLGSHGIEAHVSGRAKHIYSIWRKMQSKQLGMDQVYDMRAVRVLVDNLASCYAALGVVHTEYRHIPSAFDDYIAVPKENGYRSIHTAVIGPDGKTLEVQIRTHEMHAEAELGVCAHWSYKGEDEDADAGIGAKMDWLRHVVEWHEELGGRQSLSEELSRSLKQARIYVHTPKGHVIDLSADATPLDFAYRVHTDIGHRCVGARVDGREVPLNHQLRSGDRVEIVTSATAVPRRVWLEQEAGYVRTRRARAKIHEWLKNRGDRENYQEGIAAIGRACERMRIPMPTPAALFDLASSLGEPTVERLMVALGAGERAVRPLIGLWIAELGASGLLKDAGGSSRTVDSVTMQRLHMLARNRSGLLLDVTRVVDAHGISLQGSTARVIPDGQAEIILDFPADDLLVVYRLIENLRPLVGVFEVFREVIDE
jgi:GTP pyrophosphokinase